MATARNPFGLNDRGKKYDDAGRKGGSSRLASMLHSLITVRKRRVILILLAAWLLYLFVKNIPTDLPPVSQRIDRYGQLRPGPPSQHQQHGQAAAPPTQQQPDPDAEQEYDGPIKFFKLGSSLRFFDATSRDHVLFAFSSPKSSSHVLTAACAMAKNKRVRVGVATMGRQEMSLPALFAVNGISQDECPILWHEAQPDFALQSTVDRMQISCEAAVGHISRVLRLRAIFFDDTNREDDFLRKGMRNRVQSLRIPLLQVPKADSWMLKLGTPSLMLWNQVQIDILIHISRDAVGSLLRLLRTIQNADYRGLTYPRITIELPERVDGFIFDYLATFSWPPGSSPSDSLLTIRHRPNNKLLTPAMASSRFVESFYPTRPAYSHVLVLSENVELSTSYFQFLSYLLMEYHYGGSLDFSEQKLIGISLINAPTTLSKMDSTSPLTFFQKPDADAALYFGEEWIRLHQFLTHRQSSDPELARTIDAKLELPSTWPSWLRVTMEWMQVEGLFMAYVNLGNTDTSPVTLHSELQQVPEELAIQEQAKKTTSNGALNLGQEDDVLTAENAAELREPRGPTQSTPSLEDLLSRMPSQDGSRKSGAVGIVHSYDGQSLSWAQSHEKANEYAEQFAKVVGQCSSPRKGASLEKDGFSFLFCNEATDTES